MIASYLANDAEVVANFDKLGINLKKELVGGIGRLAIKLQTKVKEEKLSGQVLGVRTGRGRRSIQQVVEEQGTSVVGIVSTAVNYMVGWELGWPDAGVQQSLSSAKAKFDPAGGGGAEFKNGTPRERSFLRTALREMEAAGVIKAEIEAADARAISS
jgi:hypothetical protein